MLFFSASKFSINSLSDEVKANLDFDFQQEDKGMTERRQGHSKIVWDRNTSSFTTVDPHPIKKPSAKGGSSPLKCPGVGRDAENEQSLCFYFDRKVTDDEMRYLHEVMQRAVAISR